MVSGVPGAAPALEVVGLAKSYPDFRLSDITFALPAGHIMGLIGPNGAGKTTLLKLILGLARRERGTVRVFGVEPQDDEAAARGRIGFVHETPAMAGHLSLSEIKAQIAPFYARWDEMRFLRLAGRFGLPLRQRYGRLSRGTRTKFALALALSHGADLLLLDEPTTGLDPLARADFLGLLRAEIQDEGKAVLFSTQITSDLERIADYVAFLQAGRLLFADRQEEILARFRLVRGGSLPPGPPPWLLGWRRHEFGFEGLTGDERSARRGLAADAVFERPTLDDIMYFLSRGGGQDD